MSVAKNAAPANFVAAPATGAGKPTPVASPSVALLALTHLLELSNSDCSIAEREQQLLDGVKAYYQPGSGSKYDPSIGERACAVLQAWGINKLFELLDTSGAAGKQVFSPRLYSSLSGVVTIATQATNGTTALLVSVRRELEQFVARSVVPALQARKGSELLLEFYRRWSDHKTATEWIRKVCKVLDDKLVRASGAPTLTSWSMQLWKRAVFDVCKASFGSTLRDMIARDRSGEAQDNRHLVGSMLQLYVVMGACIKTNDIADLNGLTAMGRCIQADSATELYEAEFESEFLAESRSYFAARGNEWACLPATEAVTRLEGLIAHEGALLAFMHATTAPKLWEVLDAAAIAPHAEALLEQGAAGLRVQLARWDAEPDGAAPLRDLERTHRVLCRVKGVPARFAALLRAHLTAQFDALMAARCQRARDKVAAAEGGGGGGAGVAAGAGAGGDGAAAPAAARRSGFVKLDSDDPQLIVPVVETNSRYEALIANQCSRDRECSVALAESLQQLLNFDCDDGAMAELGHRLPTNCEVLAAYINCVMCGRVSAHQPTKLAPADVDRAWHRAIVLFPYLQEKDFFMECYRGALCKRLLSGRSVSLDAEKALVSELKTAQGAAFTSKVEQMLINIAPEQQEWAPVLVSTAAIVAAHNAAASAGADAVGAGGGAAALCKCAAVVSAAAGGADVKPCGVVGAVPSVPMAVKVLSSGAWPAMERVPGLQVPPALKLHTDAFTAAWRAGKGNEQKRLEWMWTQGTAEVLFRVAAAAAPPKRLGNVSTLGVAALLRFNCAEEAASVRDVACGLGLALGLVKKVLAPLCAVPVDPKDPKNPQAVLRYAGDKPGAKPRRPADDDMLQVNLDFSKVKLTAVSLPRVELDIESDDQQLQRVTEDRSFMVEAALVRIMKARKTLTHAQLTSECVSQLNTFRPEPRLIKKKIEYLLDREYLERDSTAANTYRYLA